jgi:hypothetical protein
MSSIVGRHAFRSSLVIVLLAPVGLLAPPVSSLPEQTVAPEQAIPGIAPPDTSTSGVFRAWDGVESYTGEDGEVQLIGCTPVTGIDNPHRSSTGVAVSGHGWWNKGTCSNDTARVTVCLYEWYTDGTWRQKVCGSIDDLKPGGGSSRRVTARRNCDTTQPTSWRSHVDVDVNWEVDTSEVPFRQADVACRIF